MQLNDAIKQRLDNLMQEKEIKSKYAISVDAGLYPSLLNDFYRSKIQYPRIDTLYLICEGMGITLGQFFDDPIFNIENIDVKDSTD